ncbi:MAG: hypothetical protein U5N85_23270 [Arcicella sp.]|nr:hypothetical protein [Arcicella sp.]
MKKPLLMCFVTILLMSFMSCVNNSSNEDPNPPVLVCGVKDPIKDLKWLSDEMKLQIGGQNLNGVVLFEYRNEKVIEVQCSVCSSTNIHQYFCDGTKLNLLKVDDFNDYKKNRKEIKVLYGTKIW